MKQQLARVLVLGAGVTAIAWVIFNNWWGPAACLAAYLIGTAVPANPRREDLNEFMDGLYGDLRPGQAGITVTELRPAGKATFNGTDIVDVITDAPEMIARGASVEVVRKQGNRVIVRSVRPERS